MEEKGRLVHGNEFCLHTCSRQEPEYSSEAASSRKHALIGTLKFYILAYSVLFLQTLTEDLCHAGLAFHLG